MKRSASKLTLTVYKKQRVEINLLTLPEDIQNLIFDKLNSDDIIRLSSINHEYRNMIFPIVFKNIKGTWLDYLNDKTFLNKNKDYIQQLRIVDYYSYGEWQIDFNIFIKLLPNINHLIINSGNSSNWLKYRNNDKIGELTLLFEERSSFYASNDFLSTRSPRIFDIDHVKNFSKLQKLNLYNYHFNWEFNESPNLVNLEELHLNNCTWEYPFELSQFNSNGSIKCLWITYLKSNAFILSERFNQFLIGKECFNNVETLSLSFAKDTTDISNSSKYWEKFLSWTNFTALFSGQMFPKLKYLQLHNWNLDIENLKTFLKSSSQTHNLLRLIDMKIISHKNVRLENEIKSECSSSFPSMNFKLKVVENI